jgi:DNA-directed RNA polymerase subunit RPC12/RpoP
MEYSMYVCPECSRVFKVKGIDKKVHCVDCTDIFLKDMHIDLELWKTFDAKSKNQAISYNFKDQNASPVKEETAPRDMSESVIVNDPSTPASGKKSLRETIEQPSGPAKPERFVIRNGITEYKCPNCNARLTIKENSERTVCEYCGSVYLIDDERTRTRQALEKSRQEGYEFERGRMEAQSAGAGEDLLLHLTKMIDNTNKRDELSKKAKKLTDKMVEVSENVQKYSSVFYSLIPYLICAGAALIAVVNLFESSSGILSRFVFLLIAGAAGYFGMRFSKSYISSKALQFSTEMYSLQEQVDNITRDMNKIEDDSYLEIIPPEYRTAEALKALYDFLVTKRALNIQQAITLYEDKKRNDEILRMHREQIEFQKKEIEDLKRLKQNNQTSVHASSGSSVGSALTQGVATAVTLSVIKHIKDEFF